MYVYVYIYTHIYMYTYLHMYMYTYKYVCIYCFLHICIYVYTYVIYTYIHIYIYIYYIIHIYLSTYLHMYDTVFHIEICICDYLWWEPPNPNHQGVFWMDFRDFSQGFTDVAICFDQQNKGARYTDDSAAAIKEHQAWWTWAESHLFTLQNGAGPSHV